MTTSSLRIAAPLGHASGVRHPRGTARGLAHAAHAAREAWRGAVIDPLHRVLDRHARYAGLASLSDATLRDIGMR